MKKESVLVVDFGGQYAQLIARRVRDLNIYSEIVSYKELMSAISKQIPKGIIFTGGPNSVYEQDAPLPPAEIFDSVIPMLGICYGMQAMAHVLGARVEKSPTREFGKTNTHFDTQSPLFSGIEPESITWMSHVDYVSTLATGFTAIASSDSTAIAAMACPQKQLYGVQFHLEAEQSEAGQAILHNFLYTICGLHGEWTMK